MEKKSEDNNGKITDNTKVGMPLWRFLSVIGIIAVVVFSFAMSYSNLVSNDKEINQKVEKKLDKEIFEQFKYQQTVDQKDINRKLDLIMDHLKVKDYGQETK